MAIIYRKTQKGTLEIETRVQKLAPRFRSLLILVDGRRPDDELVRLMPQAGMQALEALSAGGFIEAIGMTAEAPPPAARPAAAPPPAAPKPAAPGFEQIKREAVRALVNQVGPMADALAMKIERARNPDELKPWLLMAAEAVGNTSGRDAGADFLKRYGGD